MIRPAYPDAPPPLDLDHWRGRTRPDRDWEITGRDVRDGLVALLTVAWILGLWRWAS